MPARDEELTEEIVVDRGGWHPRYARTPVRISFGGQVHEVPVGREGVWAFVKSPSGPHVAPPALAL
jgi:hypothetical protein